MRRAKSSNPTRQAAAAATTKIRWSKRQREVIETWGRTFDPDETAAQLQISVNTVQTHLRRMREKLHCSKTLEVWVYFQEIPAVGKLRGRGLTA